MWTMMEPYSWAINKTTSERTKHVDTRYHFVHEYIEDGIMKIVFVKSKDNDADIFFQCQGEQTESVHGNIDNNIAEPENG